MVYRKQQYEYQNQQCINQLFWGETRKKRKFEQNKYMVALKIKFMPAFVKNGWFSVLFDR